MAVSNELLSTTLHAIRETHVDALFKSTPLLDQLRKIEGGVEFEDGGSSLRRPLAWNDHSTPTGLSTGYERMNTTVQDVHRYASYEWADIVMPIIISRKEELENSGDKAVIKILEARTKSVFGALRRTINKQILAGSVPLIQHGGLNTLYGHSTVTTNGFLEGAAVASQTNTIGGIQKTSTRVGWVNQFEDVGDAFSTAGKAAMDNLYLKCQSYSPEGGPNLILASLQAFANYKRTLFANERWTQSDDLDGGRMSLMYNGAPVEADADMPTSATNDQEASMYFLRTSGAKLVIHEEADFVTSDFVDMTNGQVGRQADLYLKLQLVADHLGGLGFLADGNTW